MKPICLGLLSTALTVFASGSVTPAPAQDKKATPAEEKVVKRPNQLLKLDASIAGELGVARYVVDTTDPKELYAVYGLDPSKVKEATPGWLDRFAEFLRMPVVTVLLVVIGFGLVAIGEPIWRIMKTLLPD